MLSAPPHTSACLCAASTLRAPRDLKTLTARERSVLLLVALGMGNAPIARRLGITERTVKKHVTALLGKLRVASRLEAALIAHLQHHEICRRPTAEPPAPENPWQAAPGAAWV
ncbi:response regulator transcription factor [Kitasatospora purpeofusca]|uniref:response regulator transcription factor n=1 Tax=Kitasatospora purpeofusca TaxID=67352 RepID=UPI0007C52598|nr:LuxR C-terminal-related transcriptional regulator [Kitasatospora purpeofusca]